MCAVRLDTTCLTIVFALWSVESIKKYSSITHCAYFNIFELCYCVFVFNRLLSLTVLVKSHKASNQCRFTDCI